MQRSSKVTEEDPFIQQVVEDDPFKPHSTYGSGVGYGIGINYIIGTGVFSLPYAFYSAGMGLSLVTLAVSSIFSFFCVNWVLEALARAEGITRNREQERHGDIQKGAPDHTIAWRKFDFTTLFDLFSGLKGKLFCQLVMSVYCYGVMWAYGAVFASSVSSLFYQFAFKEHCDLYSDPSQGCTNAYYICVLIYALIVVPLSCRDMEEQAIIQMAMTAYRFSAFGVMLVTVIVAFFYPNPFEAAVGHKLVQWGGFSIVFTSVAVATNFHYNVPDVVKPIRNKSILNRIVSASLCTALAFYVLVGVICGIYFKKSVQPLVTLNWLNYTGIGGGWGGSVADRPWWAAAIQLWVMLFPVFDMISIYPLVGVTLGNNILETLPQSLKIRFITRQKLLKILTRLLAAIPSLLFAMGLGRLDSIFTFTGLFAFFLELIFPCILQLLSIRMCIATWWKGAEKTPYSSIFSHQIFAWVTLVFGVIGLIFAVVTFILGLVEK